MPCGGGGGGRVVVIGDSMSIASDSPQSMPSPLHLPLALPQVSHHLGAE